MSLSDLVNLAFGNLTVVLFSDKVNLEEKENKRNKPDRATMRLDCVSACIGHVTYMERQMDE